MNRVRFDYDKFFILPSGISIYAILEQEYTHIDLAYRIINSDETLKKIYHNISRKLGEIDAISFLMANGYIYMEANPNMEGDETMLIMYDPDSIEGNPNKNKLETYLKTSDCTVYQYNELMEDGDLFEKLVCEVQNERDKINQKVECSKELQEK